MKLKEKVTYSNFVYNKDKVLSSIDITFEGSTITFIKDMPDYYWETRGNFMFEDTIASDMFSTLVLGAWWYQFYLGRDTSSSNVLASHKPKYDLLVQLLGSEDKVKKAINEVHDTEMAVLCDINYGTFDIVGTQDTTW